MIQCVPRAPVVPGQRARSSAAIAVALSTVVLASCGTSAAAENHGVGSRQFQDVVVPAGFRLSDRAHESYSREDGTYRQGHFVYLGSARVEDAAAYVRQRMPQHSWQLVEDAENEGVVRLHFERGIYAVDYTLRRREGATEMVVDYSTDYARR